MEYKDSEKQIFDKALSLLEPFNTLKTARNVTYFTDKKGEQIGNEFNCCENERCVKIVKKQLKKHYPKIHITEVFTYNDSDHDKIDFCNGCKLPMNETLTWVENELNHFAKNVTTKENIAKAYNAFCITAIFYSQPSSDKYLDKNKVLDYAKLVISELEKE